MKICIGMPTAGSIKTMTAFSLFKTAKHFKDIHLIVKETSLVHQSREEIAREVIQTDCTHLLFIDSDMVFEPEDIEKLLKRDKDIIGAPYNYRFLPPKLTVKIQDEQGNKVLKEMPDGTIECYAVCTGFMLIKTEVFRNIPHPWFFFEQDKKGKLICGEDVWFCRQARKAGYKIYFDPTTNVKHIGNYLY